MEWWINAANVAFFLSFLVRDILKLRLLSVTGGGFLIVVALLSDPPSWSTLGWNALFGVINGYQIVRLVLERRPVKLGAEEHALHRLCFATLAPRDMRTLLATARFVDVAPGERLIEAGRDPGELFVLVRGELEVRAGEEAVTTLDRGQFVGEMAFVTGKAPRADVVALASSRLAAFDARALRALLAGHADLRAALQHILGTDLAHKLRGVRRAPA